jgi:hypothetical protein
MKKKVATKKNAKKGKGGKKCSKGGVGLNRPGMWYGINNRPAPSGFYHHIGNPWHGASASDRAFFIWDKIEPYLHLGV